MENILIIEDNQDVNLMLAQAIKSAGYGVKSSFTGIDGLNEIKTNSYSLVLLDIMLPYKSGDEILKDPNAEAVVRISGKNGEGTDQLLEQIEKILQKQKLYLEKLYGYQEAGKIQLIRSHGQLLKEEYRDDGIYVEAYIPKEILGSI